MTDLPPRPTVVAYTSEPPWPLDSGGRIRTYHLLAAVHAAADLRVVCPTTPGQQTAAEVLAARGWKLIPVAVGRRSVTGEATKGVRAVLAGEPYVLYRRHAWPAVARTFARVVAEARPRAVYLDHLDGALHLPAAARAGVPAVLDLHNVYSTLVRRMADEATGAVKRSLLRREARLLAGVEAGAVRAAQAVTAVSAVEADHFRALGARTTEVIPNGVDCPSFADMPTGRGGAALEVLFLGTLSWGPNGSAARFLAGLAPPLRRMVPGARVVIVGRDPPADVRALAGDGVEVAGGVPDVRPYLAGAAVLAVPLDAGGGTRLKILEAFAAGLPVVSTAVGAEGIAADPARHYFRAERPEFIEAVASVLRDPAGAADRAAAARQLARDHYDWAAIGRRMAEVVRRAAVEVPPVRSADVGPAG
jgi:glycosyltransferase involved in cell wall biosynthesis